MKKIIMILAVLAFNISAQVDVSAGMGVGFINSPSFTDYINYYFAPADDGLPSFGTALELFAEADFDVDENYQIGVEYGHQIFSYNVNSYKAGYYDVSYIHFKPSVVGYYLIKGYGYKFKFGGGIGPRFVSMEEQLGNSISKDEYSATGVGFLLKVMGHTLLSDKLYAVIAGDIRYDMPGELADGDRKIRNISLNENVNVNSFSIGLKIGISYFF